MNPSKSIFTSRIFWVAIVQAIAGVVMVFGTAYPDAGWLMVAKSVLDIVLRSYSTQPVTL